MEIRIPIGIRKYAIWNKHLMFGEDTPNEDLWKSGYCFRCKKIFGFKFIIAEI
jgi:hypothetical protein